MARLIDAEAAVELLRRLGSREYRRKEGTIDDAMKMLFNPRYTPTIDPEGLRPHGRCRYCSPEDGAGVEWDLEDIEVSMTLRCGKLTISNSFGDEADVPIRYCPICGAKMDLEE